MTDPYFDLPGLSASALKHGATSMLAMRHYIDNPPDQTPAMRFGSLIHQFVLEPETVPDTVVTWADPKRGKAWVAFQEDNQDRTVVTADEFTTLIEINRAVNDNKTARDLLIKTEHEVVCQWQDSACGASKAKVDGLSPDLLVELKTTKTSLGQFLKTAFNMNYHIQLGWYWHGATLRYEKKHVPTYVIAVEQKPPHDVAVYRVPEPILKDGYAQAKEIACRYRIACQLENWPGIAEDEVLEYSLPSWATAGESTELIIGGEKVEV